MGKSSTCRRSIRVYQYFLLSSHCAFDNKLGIIAKPQKDSQFIASMITRELALKVTSELDKDFDKSLVNAVYNSLSRSNYYIYLAQHYDLNLLNIKNYEKYQDETLFLEEYINRCFYGSGIFNGECAYIGGLLGNGQQVQLEALRKFGENYGTALQIINDIGDFVPPDTDGLINRDFQDQYSDFKNRRLTLGLYHLLKFGSSEAGERVKDIINKRHFTKESLLEVTQLLLREGSISYAKEKAREHIKRAEKELSICKEGKTKQLLLIMATIILTNKYLVALKKIANEHYGLSNFSEAFVKSRIA